MDIATRVVTVSARSCDASIVRMVRQFELERSRLQDALAEERAKLTHQALHDYLTGLPNRPLLFNRIAHALHGADRYGGTVALLFSSTSTASMRSTTASATRPATGCWSRSPGGCRPQCVPPTPCPARR